MGFQTMDSHVGGSGKSSHVVTRKNSWFGLTLDQVKNQLGDLGKPLGSMNLDELLDNVLLAEARNCSGAGPSNDTPAATLQRQASLSLVKAFRGRTVDEVWRDLEQVRDVKGRQPTLGETTLEDFLVEAGMHVAEASLGHAMSLDTALNSQTFSYQMELSPSPSGDGTSDIPTSGRIRNYGDVDKATERRSRRKIKNRESAARSRARKQAYHSELVTKVSHLEEENLKLRKENEFDQMPSTDLSEPRYQLRRTSSA